MVASTILGISVTKEFRNINTENYKTLMEEIEEAADEWKGSRVHDRED